MARWITYHIYRMNPYIKPPKAQTLQAYHRFPWEVQAPDDIEAARESCHVTPEEQAILDKIFDEVFGKQLEENDG